jgi:16S rRNA (uracil1498-N3)-methyltransferase
MPQYFISIDGAPGVVVPVAGDDFIHLTKVRRVRIGDGIHLRDKNGTLFSGWVASIEKDHLLVEIAARIDRVDDRPQIVLGMSLLKNSNFELVVQKAVEVGVARIVPVVTERTIVNLQGKEEERLRRWNAIAREAAKQSMRSDIPVVSPAVSFSQFIKNEKDHSLRIITSPNEEGTHIRDVTGSEALSGALVLVGPEGGFSPPEIEEALGAGYSCMLFGSTQMRAETAGIVIPAIILHELSLQKKQS